MTTLSALNEEMTTKLAMYQNEKMLSDLTPVELINMAFVKGDEVFKMWKEFKRNCSKSTLRTLCETEFEETISEITSETIQKSIDKFQEEAKLQVLALKQKMQKEINSLRLQVQYKTDELY